MNCPKCGGVLKRPDYCGHCGPTKGPRLTRDALDRATEEALP